MAKAKIEKTPFRLRKAAQAYAAARLLREQAEDVFKKAEAKEEVVEAKFWELMESSGMTSVKLEGLGQFVRGVRGPYCSIKKDEGEIIVEGDVNDTYLEQFHKFLEKKGIKDEYVKEMAVLPRVNAYMRKAIEEGLELFPGIAYRFVNTVSWSQRPKDKAAPKKKIAQKKGSSK